MSLENRRICSFLKDLFLRTQEVDFFAQQFRDVKGCELLLLVTLKHSY